MSQKKAQDTSLSMSQKKASETEDEVACQAQEEDHDPSFFHAFKHESEELMKLALPIMATSCLSFMTQVVDLAMVGHLGREELAGAALANAFFSTVLFPLTGAAMAFDTLFSQSFGAKNYLLYGQWLLLGSSLMIIMALPFFFVLMRIEDIMLAIQMDPHLSEKAAKFIQLLLPGVYPFLAFTVLTKYLQNQHILAPSVVIALLTNIFNAVCNYVLIYAAGLGFEGAPIATTVSRVFQLLALVIYLVCSKTHLKTWPAISFEALRGFDSSRYWEFTKLGGMGYLMIALEAWAFDMSAILAAYLGTVALDAHSAMLNICGFTYMSFPLALSIAQSIRVGNLLGSCDHPRARSSAKAGICLNLLVASGLVAVLVAVRHHLGKLFSSDTEVVEKVAMLVPIVCLFQAFDCTQSLIAGCFRGMGRQGIVTALNLAGFWLLGLPVGAVLTFGVGEWEGVGLIGLWWGLAAGLGSTSMFGFGVLFGRIDWEAQAAAAVERSRHGGDEQGTQLEELKDSLA